MAIEAESHLLSPNQVADLFSVSPVTVRQWSQRGLLAAETTAGGHRRYARDVLVQFAKDRGMRVPFAHSNRLLIVDDNLQFNEFLQVLFTTECPDLEVNCAFDGFEAGRKVQQFDPAVVLLDIMMPGVDGIEVCRQLKADPFTRGVRVVGMTGYYSDEIARRMVDAGAETLLKKPFPAEVVIAACGFQRTEEALEEMPG